MYFTFQNESLMLFLLHLEVLYLDIYEHILKLVLISETRFGIHPQMYTTPRRFIVILVVSI